MSNESDNFKFGDKVSFRDPLGIEHFIILGRAFRESDLLRCADANGGVRLIHGRLLELGWIDGPLLQCS